MTLRRALKRLRLKDGDILLVHHDLLHSVCASRGLIKPTKSIPILAIQNKDDIRRLPFEELERIYLEAKKSWLTREQHS